MDATAQAELMRRGEVSADELLESSIGQVEAMNATVNAVVHERFDQARKELDEACRSGGVFAGVPFMVKDLLAHTAGDPFHEGIGGLARRGHVEDCDTDLIRCFRAAGLVIVGRTNTPELGLLPTTEPAAYGPTHNPWNREHTPLGSSGGSAAAVASGMVAMAHGNDAGGSIRLPASACGLVGLKPSRGRVPLGPDFGDLMSGSFAEFVVTRSVRDAAHMLDTIAAFPAVGEPYAAPHLDGSFFDACHRTDALRIGFTTIWPGGHGDTHPDCVQAVEATAGLLAGMGHHVEEAHPEALDDDGFVPHASVIMPFAYTAFALDWWERRTGITLGPDDLEPWTWFCAQRGRQVTAAQYLSAVEWLQAWTRRMAAWWAGGFDVLLTPTVPAPPPALGSIVNPTDPATTGRNSSRLVPFTFPFNTTGQPAISVPAGRNDSGLPIGIQLVGALGRDDHVLSVAGQLEQAQPWPRHPPHLTT